MFDRAAVGGIVGLAAGLVYGVVRHRPVSRTALAGLGGMLGGMLVAAAGPIRDIRHAERMINHPRPAADGAGAPRVGEMPLRVMTFNIRSLRGSVGDSAEGNVLAQVAHAINELDPDVVVLQEVDSMTDRAGRRDQVAEISQRVGASDSRFVAAMERFGGQYGQGVILRHGLRLSGDVERQVMPDPRKLDERRIALVAPVAAPDGHRFTVVGMHLTTQSATSAQQVDAVADLAQSIHTGPVIVAGDFNAHPDEVDYPMTAAGFRDAFSAIGVPQESKARGSFQGRVPIDHIFTNQGVGVRDVWVSGTGVPQFFEPNSDHHAVIADLVLPATSP